MTYMDALAYIDSLKPSGMKMGLARMERILFLFGNAHHRLKTVHIAGTNGKGSTARMVQSIATAAGYKTGLYSSPFVTGVRESITIDGIAISEQDFAQLVEELKERQGEMGEAGSLSEYELITALTLLYFVRERVDLCVMECCLGGRDDATNVISAPLAAVFTPIALDHTAILGNTIEEIAANKCGIIKAPCTVITTPEQSIEALGVIFEHASLKGLTVRIPNGSASRLLDEKLGQTTFEYRDQTWSLPLTGRFQQDNALTALEAVNCLTEKGFVIDKKAMQEGLAAATIPCRQEVIQRNPLIFMDGAHNPHGVTALCDTLQRHLPDQKITAVIGMLADKDTATCAAMLAPLCTHIVCCTPNHVRALPAARLAEQMRKDCADVLAVDSPQEALRIAQQKAGDFPLMIAGSFYVCAVLRPLLL